MQVTFQRLDCDEQDAWTIDAQPFALGRSADCQYILRGENAHAVSSRHAQLYWGGKELLLEDLDSTNGTMLNGLPIQSVVGIKAGDTIAFGKSGPQIKLLCLERDEAPVAKPAPQTESDSCDKPAAFGYARSGVTSSDSTEPSPSSSFRANNPLATQAIEESRSDSHSVLDSLLGTAAEAVDPQPKTKTSGTRQLVIDLMQGEKRKWKILAGIAIGAVLGLVSFTMVLIPEPTMQGDVAYNRLLNCVTWVVTSEGSSGTGVVVGYKGRRYILTNWHVVTDSRRVMVFFPQYHDGKLITDKSAMLLNRTGLDATVLLALGQSDCAILEVESYPDDCQPLPMATESVHAGERIFTVGNPGATENTAWIYTEGAVRNVSRERIKAKVGDKINTFDGKAIIADYPINPGDSGGPIMNDQMELIGLNMASRKKASLVNFGVDISEIRRVLANLDD